MVNQGSLMPRILLLGGTTEASLAARAIAQAGLDGVFSYAGRTDSPAPQPLPMRVGGFGGIGGLAEYLRTGRIAHVIDATHPFAAQMSHNAHAACAQAGVALLRLQRPAWVASEGDDWRNVADIAGAVAALPEQPSRVFLAIGKQNLAPFAALPQHHYSLRLVDAPAAPPLPNCTVIIAKGPFDVAGDTALLRDHAITHIIAKNAGGEGASAKLAAARALGLPVIMIARPSLPICETAASIGEMMEWIAHQTALRGV
jgi:precorrin-6A/cobalt-precorrin-6A reductase